MREHLPAVIRVILVVSWPLCGLGAAELPQSQTGADQYIQTTRNAAKTLLKNLDKFTFRLEYHGPAPHDDRSVFLSVQPAASILPPTFLKGRISTEEAAAIVGHLAASGFLYRGSVNGCKYLALPTEPYYSLSVSAGEHENYFEPIPWTTEPYKWHGMKCPPLHEQIDALRTVVIADAAKTLDVLRKHLNNSPPAGARPSSGN